MRRGRLEETIEKLKTGEAKRASQCAQACIAASVDGA
jgi:hypothetical protein